MNESPAAPRPIEAPDLKAGAKVGILLGSTLATALGIGLLARTLPKEASV